MLLGLPSVSFYRFLLRGKEVLDVFRKLPSADKYRYVAVIDAGSSGTRIHAFKFRVPKTLFGAEILDLVDDFYKPTKPGLSDYANNPAKGALTVVHLINQTNVFIPKKDRYQTPIVFRATAGLRLLRAEQANNIIEHVRSAIAKLGYKTNKNSVHIMDGADEGIFNWFAVNLLARHSIAGANLTFDDTIAALDLGGASTQVTFKDVKNKACINRNEKDHFCIPAAGNNVSLYAHSYLNLGIKQGLLSLFHHEMSVSTDNIRNLQSVCVHPRINKRPWQKIRDEQLFLSGAPTRNTMTIRQRYEQCEKQLKKRMFLELDVPPPKLNNVTRIAAVSAFYKILANYGLVDRDKGIDVLNISTLHEKAEAACLESNWTKVRLDPWKCLDLMYLFTLLHDVYGIPDSKPVYFLEKISKIQVSWTVGLAYITIVDDMLNRKPECHEKQGEDRLIKGHSTCIYYL